MSERDYLIAKALKPGALNPFGALPAPKTVNWKAGDRSGVGGQLFRSRKERAATRAFQARATSIPAPGSNDPFK